MGKALEFLEEHYSEIDAQGLEAYTEASSA